MNRITQGIAKEMRWWQVALMVAFGWTMVAGAWAALILMAVYR